MSNILPNMRRVMQCLAVEVYEGQGISNDPGRLVIYVFTSDGKAIGTIDPRLQDCGINRTCHCPLCQQVEGDL